MSALNWRHHALIQVLLTRGPQTEQQFLKIFFGITGKPTGSQQQLFNEYLLKINKELSYVQFEIRGCTNQNDGKVCYGVVNNVLDEQSKLGTKYSVPQIALYKGVIEAIVQDPAAHGSISIVDALNIRLENKVPNGVESQSQGGLQNVHPALRNFTMSQKEKTLDELVGDQWLCYCPDGSIGFGIRSFLDLRSWFHNNEVPFCDVCNEAAVKAELCQNDGCAVRMHQYCIKKKFSLKKSDGNCPSCGTQWKYQMPKSEAVDREVETNEPSQSQPHAEDTQRQRPLGSKRKRPPRTKTEPDIAEAASHQDSQPICYSRRVTRASGH